MFLHRKHTLSKASVVELGIIIIIIVPVAKVWILCVCCGVFGGSIDHKCFRSGGDEYSTHTHTQTRARAKYLWPGKKEKKRDNIFRPEDDKDTGE